MTTHSFHTVLAELRDAERRQRPVEPRPPGNLASELAPVVSFVAAFAALLAIAAPSL